MAGEQYDRRSVLAAPGGASAGVAGCARLRGGAQAEIAVPDEALRDEPIAVRLSGFDPETGVTIRARTTELGFERQRWSARAAFETDAEGAVDVTEQAPRSGTYEDVDGMGLFWSMEAGRTVSSDRERASASPSDSAETTTGASGDSLLPDPYEVTIEGDVDGETRATATTTRRVVAEGVTHESIATEEVVGDLFLPAGDGPHPGVLVLHRSSEYP